MQQAVEINLGSQHLIPFGQVLFVSGESIQKKYALAVMILNSLFNQGYNDLARNQLAINNMLGNELGMGASLGLLSKQIANADVDESEFFRYVFTLGGFTGS